MRGGKTRLLKALEIAIEALKSEPYETAAKQEPKLETASNGVRKTVAGIGGWDPVKRFDEIFRKKEGE